MPDRIELGRGPLHKLELVSENEVLDDALAVRSELEPNGVDGRIAREAPWRRLQGQGAAWADAPESGTAGAGVPCDRGAEAGGETRGGPRPGHGGRKSGGGGPGRPPGPPPPAGAARRPRRRPPRRSARTP